MERYERECKQLGLLAQKQLNLPKNVVKENFEDMSITKIYGKIEEEFHEFMDEAYIFRMLSVEPKKDIDFDKAYADLGDVAACLVGMLAKLNRMREEQNDDCA